MDNLTPEQVAYLATSIAVDLAKSRSFDEINLIKNIASQVCATLSTICSQRFLLEQKCKNKHGHTGK